MTQQASKPVGKVARTWRYPVKSMLGQATGGIDVASCGVAGDRRHAVCSTQSGKPGSGKTTADFEQIDGLLGFQACYDSDGQLEIVFPDGRTARENDADIDRRLSEALERDVRLQRRGDGAHVDASPLHLLTTASLHWLERTLPDAYTDERRFRPNLVIEAPGELPVEQDWVGRILCIGEEVRLRISEPTIRCRMVALAQGQLPHDPTILKHLRRQADLEFGVYANVIAPGRVRPGDPVLLDG